MYQEVVTSPGKALTHLFFHCCMRDDSFDKPEIQKVSDLLVKMDLQETLNFKDEVVKYQQYRQQLGDETEYINYLMNTIQPVNELALYSYCVELCLSDDELTTRESSLLETIAERLGIETGSRDVVMKLMAQRKVSETEKIS